MEEEADRGDHETQAKRGDSQQTREAPNDAVLEDESSLKEVDEQKVPGSRE